MSGVIALAVLLAGVVPAPAATTPPERTPPRLSLVQGDVSFWRPGSPDWTRARLNLALAPGDALYTGDKARLELQVGSRAFVRTDADTQLGFENQEPDFLQLKVTAGDAVADVRKLASGHTLEMDTPNGAFTINRPGYYRLQVSATRTQFVVRRGGTAVLTAAGGEPTRITANEQAVLEGTTNVAVATYAAPAIDAWDRWNYDRTDRILAAANGSGLPGGMYGGGDLSRYGRWQMTPEYGRVWVPTDESSSWAPYSAGDWISDPYYGWTWVDDAPWGWAPYHYGRWVYLNDYWAWAPGPLFVSPAYAPALVAFFGGFGAGVDFGFGLGPVGWTALGWGEPLIPWWGPSWFAGSPCWLGWGGPRFFGGGHPGRYHFRNIHEPHGFVAVPGSRFGHEPVQRARLAYADPGRARLIRGTLPVKAGTQEMAAALGHGLRPPERVLTRRVVATRAPVAPHANATGRFANPSPRLVSAPARAAAPALRAGRFAAPPRLTNLASVGSAGRGRIATPMGRGRGGSFSYASRMTPPPPPQRLTGGNTRAAAVQDAFARNGFAAGGRSLPAVGRTYAGRAGEAPSVPRGGYGVAAGRYSGSGAGVRAAAPPRVASLPSAGRFGGFRGGGGGFRGGGGFHGGGGGSFRGGGSRGGGGRR